jgi:hypothetical protein
MRFLPLEKEFGSLEDFRILKNSTFDKRRAKDSEIPEHRVFPLFFSVISACTGPQAHV